MARIDLLLYLDPGEAEVIVNLKRKNSDYERFAATVDTGAAMSLFPRYLMAELAHDPLSLEGVIIDQAGIASQSFAAVEAMVSLFLEDRKGNRTAEFQVPCWFTDTEENLIGFAGLLDGATLFLDMRETRTGWLELDD